MLGELDGRLADTPGRGMDEDRLAALETGCLHDAIVSS